MYLNRKFLAVAATLVVLSSVFAGPDVETRLKKLEADMQHVKTTTPDGTLGAKLASSRTGEMDFFASADVLLWQARVDF